MSEFAAKNSAQIHLCFFNAPMEIARFAPSKHQIITTMMFSPIITKKIIWEVIFYKRLIIDNQ